MRFCREDGEVVSLGTVEDQTTLIQRWTDRLGQEIPGAVAVFLRGSSLAGTSGPWSDVDFDVLTSIDGDDRYLIFLEPVEHPDTAAPSLRHISVGVHEMSDWLADWREPAHWAFGLAVAEATRLLWCPDPTRREELDQPFRERPAAAPELEDTVEAFGKMRNAHRARDRIALRLAAQLLGEGSVGLLRPINPPVRPGTRRQALDAALTFPVAPVGYRDDLLACLGLADVTLSPDGLLAAGQRVITGVIDLLEWHDATLDGVIEDDLLSYLRDGRLRRLVSGS